MILTPYGQIAWRAHSKGAPWGRDGKFAWQVRSEGALWWMQVLGR